MHVCLSVRLSLCSSLSGWLLKVIISCWFWWWSIEAGATTKYWNFPNHILQTVYLSIRLSVCPQQSEINSHIVTTTLYYKWRTHITAKDTIYAHSAGHRSHQLGVASKLYQQVGQLLNFRKWRLSFKSTASARALWVQWQVWQQHFKNCRHHQVEGS